MKKTILLLCLWASLCIASLCAKAQTITTVAGNGSFGSSGDLGPATAAELGQPASVVADASGNIYVADYGNSKIRKISSAGAITTIAGSYSGYSGDGGPATAATLSFPAYITMDGAGNIYFSDENNAVIRKINTAGIISTIAGNNSRSYTIGDGGPATAAFIGAPMGLAIDGAGNIYVGSYDAYRIRKITPSGIITTVAGNGTMGYSLDGGQATAAEIYNAPGLTVDGSGNLYFADQWNNVVRKVSPSGIITTVAGNGFDHAIGLGGYSGDGGPATAAELYHPSDVKLDAYGNIFISDMLNNRIRVVNSSGIIKTMAGTGVIGLAGDGGPATAAELDAPGGMVFDISGNLDFADDSNNAVRKITPDVSLSAGQITPLARHINLFPNPNDGSFVIKGEINSTDIGAVSFHITDMAGHTVYIGNIAAENGRINAPINISGLADGMYLLRLGGDGENDVLRFVVQH